MFDAISKKTIRLKVGIACVAADSPAASKLGLLIALSETNG